MAYSDFTLRKVKQDFNIQLIQVDTLLENIESVTPSNLLSEYLSSSLNLALAIGTEKAKSELIISPILLELKKRRPKISLFSGTDFNVDSSKGLNGYCDFIISLSSQQLLIEAPVLLIVEAKNDNIKSGLGQCIAEMVASQVFNNQNEDDIPIIYGAVTSGDRWKFLKLENNIVTIELTEHNITPVDHVLGILLSILN